MNMSEYFKDMPEMILDFIESVRCKNRWGFYHDSTDALMPFTFPASVSALSQQIKIRGCKTIIGLPGYDVSVVDENVKFIQSHQDEQTGLFIDPYLEKYFEASNDSDGSKRLAFRRSVSKSTISLLELYQAKPLHPYSELNTNDASDDLLDAQAYLDYIHNANWDEPWATGSHAMTKSRELYYRIEDGHIDLIPSLIEGLEMILSHQNPKTGMWGNSSIPLYEQISGTLKVVNRMKFFLGMTLPYLDKLADSCISHHAEGSFYEGIDDICVPRNVVEMCVACLIQNDYRRDELVKTLVSIGDYLLDFQQADGGFAQTKNGCSHLQCSGGKVANCTETPRSNLTGSHAAIWAYGLIGTYSGCPESPFPNPQGAWEQRVKNMKYNIEVDVSGKVIISEKKKYASSNLAARS